MSQDGTFFFDVNKTAQGGLRLIPVTSSAPLPVTGTIVATLPNPLPISGSVTATLVSNVVVPAPNSDTAALITLTGAGAGTTNSADQTNASCRGAVVVTNISAKSGTIDVVTNVQGKDAASGTYYTILSSASATSTGGVAMVVYPGVAATTNTAANFPLPHTWRVQIVSGTGTTPSVTCTVGASLIE